jgi:hypothetical protein
VDKDELLTLLYDAPEQLRAPSPHLVHGTTVEAALAERGEQRELADKLLSRYESAWRKMGDPNFTQQQATDELLDLMQIDPAKLTAEQRRAYRTLAFDLPPDLLPEGPRVFNGAKMYAALELLGEQHEASAKLMNLFASIWTHSHDPALTRAQVSDQVMALMEKEASTWAEGERAALDMMLFQYPKRVQPDGPRTLKTMSLEHLLRTRKPDEHTVRELERYRKAWLFAADTRNTLEAATTRAREIARIPAVNVTAEEIDELRRIMFDAPEGVRPDLPLTVGNVAVHDMLSNFGQHKTAYINAFDRWGAAVTFAADQSNNRDTAIARASEIFARDPNRMYQRERNELAALLHDLPNAVRPERMDCFGVVSLEMALELFNDNPRFYSEMFGHYRDAWNATHDPEAARAIQQRVDQLVQGASDERLSEQIGMGMWKEQIATSLPPTGIERAERLLGILDGVRPDQQPSIYQHYLTMLSESLSFDVLEHLVPLRDEIHRLADWNVSRMRGNTPEEAVDGYAQAPEYSDIGELRSKLQMLSTLLGTTSTPPAPSETVAWR